MRLAEQLRVQFDESKSHQRLVLVVVARDCAPFRQDARFQAFTTRLGLMAFWQKYGPPDDCDLKDGKLTCH